MLKICDSAFLAVVARYMADTGKRERIRDYASTSGQYSVYQLPPELRTELEKQTERLSHHEKQRLGIYHGYTQRDRISRVWLDRWAKRFPALAELIGFALTLRPVETIERGLALPETFFDFTVERHNNYVAGNSGLAVIHNCGIGYEHSTLRPRGAYVSGAGAYTSGPLSFMDIFDKMCFTVSSAGGRRGAQMGTLMSATRMHGVHSRQARKRPSAPIQPVAAGHRRVHPGSARGSRVEARLPADAEGIRGREARSDDAAKFVWREWPIHDSYVVNDEGLVACKVYKTLPARRMWDVIMTSTYDFAEPGFILIDRVNEMNNNWWCENIRATNPCGEQPLPPYGSCLLGSVNLTRFVKRPVQATARFDWGEYREVVRVFTRMLDNVVEVNGLPLAQQREEIIRKRRHGMGFLGLGSHHHAARHEVRLGRGGASSPRMCRARWRWPAGKPRWSCAREGPGADHERGVHGHGRCCASVRRWRATAGSGREDRRPLLHASTAATCSASPRWRRSWWKSSPRSVRASRTTARSPRPARSRCRSRTMPATASSPRSRITISAT